jgi:hypothetical protein
MLIFSKRFLPAQFAETTTSIDPQPASVCDLTDTAANAATFARAQQAEPLPKANDPQKLDDFPGEYRILLEPPSPQALLSVQSVEALEQRMRQQAVQRAADKSPR